MPLLPAIRTGPPHARAVTAARAPRRRVVTLPFVCAAVLFAACPVHAHHGWSEYDASRTLSLTGAIVESGYENPHGFVRLKTAERMWRVVLAPPSRMEARGLSRAGLRPGTTVTVVGYPHRSDAQELRAERISVEGGAPVELR